MSRCQLIRRDFLLSLLGLLTSWFLPNVGVADDWSFRLQFSETARAEPFTGRVYVFFASDDSEPRHGPNWFHPQPMIARDVEGLRPGQVIELTLPTPLTFPKQIDPSSLASLKAQAVIRFNPLEREVGDGPGNGYSSIVTLPETPAAVEFTVDQLVKPQPLEDNEWCRHFSVPSKLLSEFHGRSVVTEAAVNFPPAYFTEPERRFPVIFEIPGFGGTLHRVWPTSAHHPATEQDVQFIHVTLEGHCELGHHEFADSDNNGPRGRALIEEFLPAFDAEFRSIASPHARFLTGHSSGGWSSLWLQVAYPDVFGGTWSTAPDPVDFRDFQRINLYKPGENMYRAADGSRRPLARKGDQPFLWYDDFCRMEDVLGHGGQLHSFEAVFSHRGREGTPIRLWNRETGAIATDVAESWKRYDIGLILRENWPTLRPRLAGKIHVFMGDLDTFYLESATKLLKETLEDLGSDAAVEIHPGKDHGSLMTSELRARIPREMSQAFLKAR